MLFPFIVALTLSVLEFGWWVNAHMVVSNAAAQAARAVAQQGIVSNNNVPDQIRTTLAGGDLAVNSASYNGSMAGYPFAGPATGYQPMFCAPEPGGGYAPEPVTVTVTYHYHLLFPFLATPMFLDIGKALPTTITSTATVPVEQEWAGNC